MVLQLSELNGDGESPSYAVSLVDLRSEESASFQGLVKEFSSYQDKF